MHFISTRVARRLTGLSTEQLRDWTSRRALIPADVKPKGHGSPARYSWQTILLLRIAVILRDRFKLELQAHRLLFADFGDHLSRVGFSSLCGKVLTLRGGSGWKLLEPAELVNVSGNYIVVDLAPHLEVLAEAFSVLPSNAPERFRSFPALGSRKRGVSRVSSIDNRKEAKLGK